MAYEKAKVTIDLAEYNELIKLRDEQKKENSFSRRDVALAFIYGAREVQKNAMTISTRIAPCISQAKDYLQWVCERKLDGIEDDEFKNENFE